mmetsp:Transcript_7532/g.18820  ORF Transcript_7532/g.18820 Transcript_7532/m.18820 type:complete len:276 (-) Transcript_7532:51-878(-)
MFRVTHVSQQSGFPNKLFVVHVLKQKVQQVNVGILEDPRIVFEFGVQPARWRRKGLLLWLQSIHFHICTAGIPQVLNVFVPVVQEFQNFGQRWNLEESVKSRRSFFVASSKPLVQPQLLELLECKIVNPITVEIAVICGCIFLLLFFFVHRQGFVLGSAKNFQHVGSLGQIQGMHRHQITVLGGNQIRFDVIRPQFKSQPIGFERVFGKVCRGSAVGNHNLRVGVTVLMPGQGGFGADREWKRLAPGELWSSIGSGGSTASCLPSLLEAAFSHRR